MIIAWDIDDTIIIPKIVFDTNQDIPNYEVINIYRWFQSQGHRMIIWSGGGVDYAKWWATKLGLDPDEVRVKQKYDDIDIAFDDCIVDLARVNIQVKRLKNNINRK